MNRREQTIIDITDGLLSTPLSQANTNEADNPIKVQNLLIKQKGGSSPADVLWPGGIIPANFTKNNKWQTECSPEITCPKGSAKEIGSQQGQNQGKMKNPS
jgi:hypothetical protein